MLSFIIPHYKIFSKVGYNRRVLGKNKIYKIPKILYAHCGRFKFFHSVGVGWQGGKNFNPFRDLADGGTTLRYKEKTYWVADDCLVGKILKLIFA